MKAYTYLRGDGMRKKLEELPLSAEKINALKG